MFDNNDKTGILFHNNWGLYKHVRRFIVITMPVLKSFTGKLKMNFYNFASYGFTLPNNMTINTADSFTYDDLKNKKELENLEFFNSFFENIYFGVVKIKPTNKFIDSVNLNISINYEMYKDSYISKSWDLDLKKPFNSIIFSFNGGGFHERVWITSIIFEKTR